MNMIKNVELSIYHVILQNRYLILWTY